MWYPKDKEQEEWVIQKYKEINNMSQILRELGLSMSEKYSLNRFLIEKGIKTISKKQDKKQYENKICELYKSNYTLKQIREYFLKNEKITMDESTISKILKKHEIKLRSGKEFNLKYEKDINAFSKYDKFSCYWAGLIAADGCIVHRINTSPYLTINLTEDYDTVKGLKEYLGYSGPIKHKIKDGKNIYGIIVVSTKIVENLENNFNITSNKTLTFTPSERIPNKLRKFFILGIMDGDGCISSAPTKTERKQYNLSFVGTLETCEYIKRYLRKENLKLRKRFPERKNNNYILNIQGNNQLVKILNDFYSDEEINKICMQRKYEKYKLLLKQQNKK